MVSAGWPLTGFAVFILPFTEASETQHMDRHLPGPANPPPSVFASPRPPTNIPRPPTNSPRPPTNSPRSIFHRTTSSTAMSTPAGTSSPSSAVDLCVPSATHLQALPSSLDVCNHNPTPLWASHSQQQLTSTLVHMKKRNRSEEDSPDEQQQQQWHQPQEGHVTKAAVKLLPAGQRGEVVVTGVGVAAGYYRLAHLQG